MIALVEQRFYDTGRLSEANSAEARTFSPGEVRSVLVNSRAELSREILRAGLSSEPYRDDRVSEVLRNMDVAKAIAAYLEKEGRRPVDRREGLIEWKAGYAVFGLGVLGVLAGVVSGLASNPFLGIVVAVLGCLGLVIGMSLMGVGQADYRPSRALREQRRADCRALIAHNLTRGETKTA